MMRRIIGGALIASTISAAAIAQQPAPTDSAARMTCDRIASLRLPDVKIDPGTAVPAATTGVIRAAHCRVTGVIGTEIRFSLLLPDMWNGKFMMGGGGGYVGSLDNQAQGSVNLGYATAGTDTGHQGGLTDASWALNNLERQVNFGYLAVHRTAEVSKALIRSYYGANESRSYFSGCSNGGRQALMEAQRFPNDFDGIVAGAPALDFVGIAAQFVKDIQAVFPSPANVTPLFPLDTLKAVETQIVEACDAVDGVKDGLMEDPRRCKVDVSALTGVSDAQRTALKKVYAETRGKADTIYPAQPFGGEGETAGWGTWITGTGKPLTPQGPSLRFAFGTQFFKFFVFNNPDWDYAQYDVSNARKDGALTATVLNATSPDLNSFKGLRRKLIVWHGWSDPALTALGSINYYEQVQARDSTLRDYFRMFMMPGVLHCAGGPGPDTADWISTIVDWVEKGQPPDRVIARKVAAGGAATRSRPLCPYPQRAEYKGSGSIDDAASFVCR
jgi:tannase/feruloyl esterase